MAEDICRASVNQAGGNRVESWLLCFLALGKTCFPLTLTHSLILTHMLEHKSTIKHPRSKTQANSAWQWIFAWLWQPLSEIWARPGLSGMPAMNKGWLLKKKTREVLLRGGGVPNMHGNPRSGAMPSGWKCCEEWQCQSETSLTSLDLSICRQ